MVHWPAGAVYVAGNPSAVAAILSVSDTLHTITFFNGDDAMELRYMPTNTSLDVIGTIGFDPGTNWVVGTGATSEFTLVRQFVHKDGETNWTIGVTEWDVYPQQIQQLFLVAIPVHHVVSTQLLVLQLLLVFHTLGLKME